MSREATPINVLVAYASAIPGYGELVGSPKQRGEVDRPKVKAHADPTSSPLLRTPARKPPTGSRAGAFKGQAPPHYAVREPRPGNAWLDLFCGIRRYHQPARHGACFDAIHYPRRLFLTVCLDTTGRPSYARAYDDVEGVARELTGEGARKKVGEVWETCDKPARAPAVWTPAGKAQPPPWATAMPAASKGRPRGEPKVRKKRATPRPVGARKRAPETDIPDFD